MVLLDHWEVRATGGEGGRVELTRGLLALLSSEAALAGVLALASEHVAPPAAAGQDGHGLPRPAPGRECAGSALASVVSRLDALVLGYSRPPGAPCPPAVGAGAAGEAESPILSRQTVSAVARARHRVVAAGYDEAGIGEGLRLLWPRLLARGEIRRVLARPLPPHPGGGARSLETLLRLARGTPPRVAPAPGSRVGRESWLAALDGLPVGAPPGEGFVDGDRFILPPLGLALQIPQGWTLDNGPGAVVLRAPGTGVGVALRVYSGGDLGLTRVLDRLALPCETGPSPDRPWVREPGGTGPDGRGGESGARFRARRWGAHVVVLTPRGEQEWSGHPPPSGQAGGIPLPGVPELRGDRGESGVEARPDPGARGGGTPETGSTGGWPGGRGPEGNAALDAIAASMRALPSREIHALLAARPEPRLRVLRSRGESWDALARRSGLPPSLHTLLATLNAAGQGRPHDRVPPGSLVKTVEQGESAPDGAPRSAEEPQPALISPNGPARDRSTGPLAHR